MSRCWIRFGLDSRPLTALVLCVLSLAAVPKAGRAQGKDTGQFMAQATVRVTNIAASPRYRDYGYANGISILGGWINEKASLDFTMDMAGGVDYLIVAGGDRDAQDVDLEILDARRTVVAVDRGLAADAIVPFRPAANGRYTLRLTLFQSNRSFPCVCVATVLKKNGWLVPVKNLDNATDQVINAMTRADDTAKRFSRRVDLRRAPNQWAFFGGVLNKGENLAVINLDLGFGDRLFVGGGDTFARTLHLELEDAAGRVLKRDPKNAAISVLDYGATGNRHGLRVHNSDCTGPAVVLMAVFDVR